MVSSAISSSQNMRASSRADSVAKRRSRINSGSAAWRPVSQCVSTRSTIRRRNLAAPPSVSTNPVSWMTSSAARNAAKVDSGKPARINSACRLAPPRSCSSAETRPCGKPDNSAIADSNSS